MPPKKTLKDLQSSPVYSMAHEDQVRLLSDALLREYMHRRGFLDALKAFDEENPRDEQTISSRALMSDLMALSGADQTRLKAQGIETIMEMLIDLRVEKRLHVETLQEELQRPIPAVPAEYITARANLEKRKQKKRDKADAAGDSATDDDDVSDTDLDNNGVDDAAAAAAKKKKKKDKKAKKKKKSKHADMDDDVDDADSDTEARKARKKAKKAKRNAAANAARPLLPGETAAVMTLDELLASDSASSNDANDASGDDDDDDDVDRLNRRGSKKGGAEPYLKAVEAPQWLREAALGHSPQSADGENAHGRDVAVDGRERASANKIHSSNALADVDDNDENDNSDEEEEETLPELSPSVLEGSEALAAEAAQAACRVLLGPHVTSPPAAFLCQGFVFDDLLEFALIQWKRGPGAVVAPLQALVAAFLYEKERYLGVSARQREALQRALCAVLFKAQPDVRNICLVDGRFRRADPRRGFLSRMTRHFRAWTGFDERQEVEAKVAELVEHHWSEEKDAGLWCFLVSVVLSRGAAAVTTDMESSSGGGGAAAGAAVMTLIDGKSGDGTEALANLCITGRAVCFHHDGTVPGKDGRLLRGYTGGVSTGLLDGELLPHPLLTPATIEKLTFHYAREPTLASWVVTHGGHYSNLFMTKDGRKSLEQKRALGGKATVELIYWDALTDDEEAKLTVTVDTAQALGLGGQGTSASRQANASFVNRAVLQVPDWAMGLIDWNGAKVIRH